MRGSTSSTPPTSTQPGESEEIVGKALQGPARRRRAGHEVRTARWASDPNQQGGSRRWIMRRGRGFSCAACRPTTSTSTRSTARRRTPTSTRRSAALTDLVRAGQGPCHRLARRSRLTRSSRRSGSPSVVGCERFRTEQPPYSMLVRGVESGRAADLPALRDGRDAPGARLAGGWLIRSPSQRGGAGPTAPMRPDGQRPLRPLAAGERAQLLRHRSSTTTSPTRPGSP